MQILLLGNKAPNPLPIPTLTSPPPKISQIPFTLSASLPHSQPPFTLIPNPLHPLGLPSSFSASLPPNPKSPSPYRPPFLNQRPIHPNPSSPSFSASLHHPHSRPHNLHLSVTHGLPISQISHPPHLLVTLGLPMSQIPEIPHPLGLPNPSSPSRPLKSLNSRQNPLK